MVVQKKSPTVQASDDLQARVRYRQAKTKALQDPKLQQLWARAQKAPSDQQKRELLKSFYDALYARILKINGSLKPRVKLARQSQQWRLAPQGFSPPAVAELVEPERSLQR